jgi:hypothetical protein
MIYSLAVELVDDIIRNLRFPRKLQHLFAKVPAFLLVDEELDRLSNHRGDGFFSFSARRCTSFPIFSGT